MEIIELENAEFQEITDERVSLSAYCKAKNLSRILDNRVIHGITRMDSDLEILAMPSCNLYFFKIMLIDDSL